MDDMQNVRHTDMLNRIGSGLRLVRHLRHMTMSELADRMTELGDESVSGRMIGAWERGENEITATHLVYLSRALECSLFVLFGLSSQNNTTEELLVEEIRSLSKREQEILLWLSTEWEGNKHPLIELALTYACMKPDDRAEASAFTIVQYKEALKRNAVPPRAIDPDIFYLECETDSL